MHVDMIKDPKIFVFIYSEEDLLKCLEEINGSAKMRQTSRKYYIPHSTVIDKPIMMKICLPQNYETDLDKIIPDFRSDYTYFPESNFWLKVFPEPVDTPTGAFVCHYEGAQFFPLAPIFLESFGLNRNKNKQIPKKLIGFDTIKEIVFQIAANTSWDAERTKCLTYTYGGYLWDGQCPERYPFVCYREPSEKDKITECGTVDEGYEENWPKSSPTHCHKYHYDPATWDQAYSICRAEGGHLAVINSEEEALNLNETFTFYRPLFNETQPVFLGYREWGAGEWWTLHGQTLPEAGFDKWCNGCPEKAKRIEKSTDLYCGGFANGWLEDVPCDKPLEFICEKRADSLTNKEKPYKYELYKTSSFLDASIDKLSETYPDHAGGPSRVLEPADDADDAERVTHPPAPMETLLPLPSLKFANQDETRNT